MAFLENLGKKVGEAAQAAAKKSGELVETTKLSVNISSEEDKIQKLYTQIGKIVYDKYTASGDIDAECKEACEAIKLHEQSIKGLKDKILEVKGVKVCVNCGSEMDKAQLFCAKCGAKNEVVPVQSEPEAAAPVCPNCGNAVPEGAMFCASCGTKLSC